jgi:hypothetical protein
MEVSVQEGPVYAPLPLASEIEVVNTPVTGAEAFGDAGPWMLTTPPVKVAVNPGGRLPVPHSIAVFETATPVKPYPAAAHQVFNSERRSAPLPAFVKFQPVGATNVTVVIA